MNIAFNNLNYKTASLLYLNRNNYGLSFGDSSKKKVELVDSDFQNHSTNLKHLAEALSSDIEVEQVFVKDSKNPYFRNLKDMDKKLDDIIKRKKNGEQIDYIALPTLCDININHMSSVINRVNPPKDGSVKLTPENLADNRKIILDTLKLISKHPRKYKEILAEIDNPQERGQNLEYAYPVIQKINEAVKLGIDTYIIAGNGPENPLKWECKELGIKDELYYYVATQKDPYNMINYLKQSQVDRGWEQFNLLNLSDAKIIGVNNADGQKYIYGTQNSLVNNYARGVFNFCPVRKKGSNKILGYSFTDKKTVQYSRKDWEKESDSSTDNIEKFVGLKLDEVLATDEEHEILKDIANKPEKTKKDDEKLKKLSDRLFDIKKIFTPEKIIKEKMLIKGDYVDSSMNLFFRKNDDNEVIFPKCDCEGSGRPSVVSMSGSCLAVIQAIADNVEKNKTQSQQEKKQILDLTA